MTMKELMPGQVIPGVIGVIVGILIALVVIGAACGQDPDAPTPMAEVEKVLAHLKLTPKDVLFDLGCGDGRVCITATRTYGCQTIGVDRNLEKIEQARKLASISGVFKQAEFWHWDITHPVIQSHMDSRGVTVVYVYLPQPLLNRLTPKLQKHENLRLLIPNGSAKRTAYPQPPFA